MSESRLCCVPSLWWGRHGCRQLPRLSLSLERDEDTCDGRLKCPEAHTSHVQLQPTPHTCSRSPHLTRAAASLPALPRDAAAGDVGGAGTDEAQRLPRTRTR